MNAYAGGAAPASGRRGVWSVCRVVAAKFVGIVWRRSRSGLWEQLRPDVVAWTILVFARLIEAIRGELGSASARARELMEQAAAARTRAGSSKRDESSSTGDLPPW